MHPVTVSISWLETAYIHANFYRKPILHRKVAQVDLFFGF